MHMNVQDPAPQPYMEVNEHEMSMNHTAETYQMQLKFLEVRPKKRLYPAHLQDLPNVALTQQIRQAGFLKQRFGHPWASSQQCTFEIFFNLFPIRSFLERNDKVKMTRSEAVNPSKSMRHYSSSRFPILKEIHCQRSDVL